MRTRPEMFCPKSTSVAPLGDDEMLTGRSVSIGRTGGPLGATRRSATDGNSRTSAQSRSS